MSRIEESGEILRQIRARTAALDACAGHVFRRLDAADPRRVGTRTWHCERCDQVVDASFGVAYMQGIAHAQKGHKKDDCFPGDKPVGY